MKDIFICHASEDKERIVRPLASALSEAGITYWLDEAEISWGDSFINKINDGIKISKYIIVVLSTNFVYKNWPLQELQAALNLEFSSGKVKVLPLLAGSDSEKNKILQQLPLINHKFYITWQGNSEQIVKELKKRLEIDIFSDNSQTLKNKFNIPIKKVEKKYTQHDKDLFLKNTLNVIKEYFQQGLNELEKHDSDLATDFDEINKHKFICKVYAQGEPKFQCKIWIDNSYNQILYSTSVNYNNDNSHNDYGYVDSDEYELFIHLSNMGLMLGSESEKKVNPEKTAEYFWNRFTSNR